MENFAKRKKANGQTMIYNNKKLHRKQKVDISIYLNVYMNAMLELGHLTLLISCLKCI
jgi:hypothetical protein